jgi:hypothetical protein
VEDKSSLFTDTQNEDVLKYWYHDETMLCDTFEPNFLRNALVSGPSIKPFNLSHLIFGREQWVSFIGGAQSTTGQQHDPLTIFFDERGEYIIIQHSSIGTAPYFSIV